MSTRADSLYERLGHEHRNVKTLPPAISCCDVSAQKLGLHHVAHLDQRPVATKTRP